MRVVSLISEKTQDEDLRIVSAVSEFLLANGHTVINMHAVLVGSSDSIKDAQDLLNESDFVIAELGTPSLEVGYNFQQAVSLKKPIFAFWAEEVFVSNMIRGIPFEFVSFVPYKSEKDLLQKFRAFIEKLRLDIQDHE